MNRPLLSLLILFNLVFVNACVVSKTNYAPQSLGVASSQPASAPVAADGAERSIRIPLLYSSLPLEGGGRERSVLWPLFVQRTTPTERRTHLLPLYFRGVLVARNGATSTMFAAPFLTWITNNKPPEGGPEAPIIHRMRALFPLYMEGIARGGEVGERIVLFPFFRYGWGDEGRYVRLWPLPKWQFSAADTDESSE